MTDHPAEHVIDPQDYIRAGYEYLFSLPAPLFKAIIIAEIKNSIDYWDGRISRIDYLRWKNLSWFTKEAIVAREIGRPNA